MPMLFSYFMQSNTFYRFLNRTAKHPELRVDPYFVQFLELDGDLPKATSTSALSGAGVMRLFSKVGDSIGKMTFKMDETDQVIMNYWGREDVLFLPITLVLADLALF